MKKFIIQFQNRCMSDPLLSTLISKINKFGFGLPLINHYFKFATKMFQIRYYA